MQDLFNWRNHPDIRKKSFNTKPISWDEHERWFKEKTGDSKTTIYMAYCQEQKIGTVRFEDIGNAIKVSIMLNPEYLSKGFGSNIIKIGTEKFIKENTSLRPICAEIRVDNIISIKAFQEAGYKGNHMVLMYKNE
ncbi:MAG TPA: hypothetical protein DD713_03920 [Nitrospiraceae bacterium]|nr:hypothetical protein [Nitrospiraceae bacterium]